MTGTSFSVYDTLRHTIEKDLPIDPREPGYTQTLWGVKLLSHHLLFSVIINNNSGRKPFGFT